MDFLEFDFQNNKFVKWLLLILSLGGLIGVIDGLMILV